MALGAPIARRVRPAASECRTTDSSADRNGACRAQRIGWVLIVTFGLTALAGCQSAPPARTATAAATAEDAEARFMSALAGDIAALEPLLADDFLYATSGGTVLDRSGLLEHLRSGATRVDRVVAEELRKLRHEGLVVTMGHLVVDARQGGKSFQVRSRYVHVWIETDAGWQLLVRESDVPPPRPQ